VIASSLLVASIESARRQLADRPLVAASDVHRWTSIAVEECAGYTVEDLISPARDHHVVTMCLEGSPFVMQERCGQRYEGSAFAGEATVMPAGYRVRFRGQFPAYLAMRVSPALLDEAGAELRRAGSPRADVTNCFRANDPVLYRIAQLFSLELRSPAHPAQLLLIQSLASALSLHLLREYTKATGVEHRSGVSVGVAAIKRALAYINDQPNRTMSLDELAAAAGLSRFHFSREFKRHVGLTPSRYVERVRIERAK
jgi:AraC family transcriptional regulator